jgi:hypothetical protein
MVIACNACDEDAIRDLLSELVPEWSAYETEHHPAPGLVAEGKMAVGAESPVLH